ncbi:phosphofructokinase [Corynebacterium atypicum]|uniref:Phosphofructokinase n=1 Tax=Corynebacterium atypicum TaxID=191610 RepID=A0ABM5QMK6_9CORY|nr:1-phosphofructokinase family hexose kinase [Corynebacterium atypicum]AIG64013.1 phosphofructokinase [Corynebacterium atypicum]
MIVTLTPNPSTDATLTLAGSLARGSVLRARTVTHVAGGKGVNVAHAAHLADAETLAVFPAADEDPYLPLVRATGVPYLAGPSTGTVRTNTTITEPDGTTTKINGPGPELSPADLDHLLALAAGAASESPDSWLVLAGSLPPGVPHDWYGRAVNEVRAQAPGLRVALDTSDAAMVALGEGFPGFAPDLIKPNGLELGQLVGCDGAGLEAAAARGEYEGVVAAARKVTERGVGNVLVTLGGSGAVLVTYAGAWRATPPPTRVLSTVGAGDSSLAGYLLAAEQSASAPERLRQAVAYGSAAAGLPGTQLPRPDQVNLAATQVTSLD